MGVGGGGNDLYNTDISNDKDCITICGLFQYFCFCDSMNSLGFSEASEEHSGVDRTPRPGPDLLLIILITLTTVISVHN